METGLERIQKRHEVNQGYGSLHWPIISRGNEYGRICVDSKTLGPWGRWPDRDGGKGALGNGWTTCSNPFTARDIEHRTSDAYISQNPASRKSARWVSPALMIGRSSAAPPRYCRPYMRRTFYRVGLVADLDEEPIKPWPPSMR